MIGLFIIYVLKLSEKVKRSKRAIHEEENDQIEDYIKVSIQLLIYFP